MRTTATRRRPESELRTRVARVVYTAPDRALIDTLMATFEDWLVEKGATR